MDTFTVSILVHATAAFLVLLLGPVTMFRPRRDALHRALGRTWVLLMYVTCLSSFFFGLEDGLGALHGLSAFTAIMVTLGVINIRRGRVSSHRATMVGSFAGTLIAFGFAALVPNRLIWTTTTTQPTAVLIFVTALVIIAGAWIGVLRIRLPEPAQSPIQHPARR